MNNKNEEDIADLIANSNSVNDAKPSVDANGNQTENVLDSEVSDKRFFKAYKIKDIVFLAIVTACTLVTGAVMPLLVNVPVFGIIQLGLGLQFSLFPVIGLMKVRKPGALLFQAVFISVFLVFMFPPMVLIIICGVIAETIALVIFKGYENDWACVLAGTLYMPITIPFLYLYYNCFYTVVGDEKAAVSMFLGGTDTWVVIGISAAVVALCFVGSLVGMLISRELRKAGKFK